MKALGLVEDFWKFNFKTYLLTRDLLMQQTGMVWTTLIGDHPGIIPLDDAIYQIWKLWAL